MRFIELHLRRFGHFTNVIVPLFVESPRPDSSKPTEESSPSLLDVELPPQGGLHLVYGPNEAGKSTTLRAITQLLFGFPHQTQDDFLHSSRDLRVGGILEVGSERLAMTRRKGRKGTLFAGDDESELDASVLEQALQGLDLDRFRSQFGINYEQLVDGGREIVAGKGSVGELLFSAGAGIAGIHRLRDQLKKEAELLFSPRGINQRIAVQIKELERLKQERKTAVLATDRWVRLDQELDALSAQKESLEAQKYEAQRELDRNQRWLKAIPLAQRRQQLLARLEVFAAVPRLPQGFPERRVRVLTQWRRVEEQLARQRERCALATTDLDNCTVDQAVLDVAGEIQQLKDEWSVHATAQRDSDELLRRQETNRDRLKWLQQELGQSLDWDSQQRRLTSLERQTIFELIKQQQRLTIDRDEKLQRLNEISEEGRRWQQELAESGPSFDLAGLDFSISQAQAALAQAQAHEKLRHTLAKQQRDLGRLCQKAELPADAATWLAWKIPSGETIDHFSDRIRSEQAAWEQAQLRCAEELERLETVKQQWNQLQLVHQVPREEELQTARQQRDRLWLEILVQWETRRSSKKSADSPAAHWESLVAEFVAAQMQTDQLADRLLQAANHVATQRRLQAEQITAEQRLMELSQIVAQRQTQRDSVLAEWQSLWQPLGLAAKLPSEMKVWQRLHEQAVTLDREIAEAEAELQRVDQRVERQLAELNRRRQECLVAIRSMAPVDASAADAVDLVQQLAEEISLSSAARQSAFEYNQRRQQAIDGARQVSARLPGLQAECERAEVALREWQSAWHQALQPLQLDGEVTPQAAQHVLEIRQQFEEIWSSIGQNQKRIDDMQSNLQNYRQRLNQLAERLKRPSSDLAEGALIAELHRRLVAAQEQAAVSKEAHQRLKDQQQRLEEFERERATVQVDLQMLLVDAQVEQPDGLIEVERQYIELEKLESELKQLELQLTELASGKALDAFIEEVLVGDAHQLQVQGTTLLERLTALQLQLDEGNTAIGERRSELRQFDGNATAAELEQQIQQVLTSLRNDAEQYARLRVSMTILDEAMRRYKEKNQGPIVQRASEIFSQLTLGAFVGLRVDFVEDENILVGVRGNQQTVRVDAMSEGTSDQLFLALRLASLEIYFDQHQPVPVIIDDILINFDDERAQAALAALQRLARRTQVIYFTHHPHLLGLMAQIREPGTFICHLPAPNSASGQVRESLFGDL